MSTKTQLLESKYRTIATTALRNTVYAIGFGSFVIAGFLIWTFAYMGLYEVFHNGGVFEEPVTEFLFTFAFGVLAAAFFGVLAAAAARVFGSRVALWKGAVLAVAAATIATAVELAATGGV